jgi:hypothetical protein
MRKQFILLLPALLIMCVSLTVEAQQTAFTYQGKLTDNGTPANGKYDLQFALFDSASGGAQIGQTQTVDKVSASGGVFTVTLDFGPAAFPGAARFLEISTRPTGAEVFTLLTPRQPISSTPYAVRSFSSAISDTAANATNAQQLGGAAASQYVRTSDARLSDSRTPTAGSSNYIQNTTSQQAVTNFNISGNGTAAGTLSGNVLNATTRYDLAGQRVLDARPTNLNTFLGFGAGASNTTGDHNSAFGNGAGRMATDAIFNSFFGALAGEKTTGTGNSFFGAEAGLNNTTGANNVFVGDQAGYANTIGNNNVAVGDLAGVSSTTQSNNTFIGAASDGAVGVYNATAIGANAKVTHSDSIVLGSIAGVNGALNNTNVGIGTTDPRYTLDVRGHANFTGNILANTVVATNQFNLNATRILFFTSNALHVGGGQGVAIGSTFGSGYQLEVVSQYDKGLRVGTLGAGGAVLSVGGAGDVQVDANGVIGGRFVIKENGNVGIGQNNPGAKLEVGGNIKFTGLGVGGNTQLCRNDAGEIAQCSSSLRYKTDLRPFTGGLNLIDRLHPVSFKWKSDQSLDLGLGAEDVAAVEPLLVTHNATGAVEGVKYDRLNVVLINAIKEQQAQIKSQNEVVATLQARLASLEQAIQQQPQHHHQRKKVRKILRSQTGSKVDQSGS